MASDPLAGARRVRRCLHPLRSPRLRSPGLGRFARKKSLQNSSSDQRKEGRNCQRCEFIIYLIYLTSECPWKKYPFHISTYIHFLAMFKESSTIAFRLGSHQQVGNPQEFDGTDPGQRYRNRSLKRARYCSMIVGYIPKKHHECIYIPYTI